MSRVSIESQCDDCGKVLRYMPFVTSEPVTKCFEHSFNESGDRICPNPKCIDPKTGARSILLKPPYKQCFRCMLDLIIND